MRHVVVGIISRRNSENDEEYLLVKSVADFGKYTGFWYPPGGHINKDETESSALKREIKEELDIDIKPIKKMAETKGDWPDQITYWWECSVDSYEITINKDEIADAGYFTREQMKKMDVFPATIKFFEEYISNN